MSVLQVVLLSAQSIPPTINRVSYRLSAPTASGAADEGLTARSSCIVADSCLSLWAVVIEYDVS